MHTQPAKPAGASDNDLNASFRFPRPEDGQEETSDL